MAHGSRRVCVPPGLPQGSMPPAAMYSWPSSGEAGTHVMTSRTVLLR